jgi:S-DNA-T family DNA segregation ATPase FtsK/SpoIIIE
VITGLIKSNILTRIAFMTAGMTDSPFPTRTQGAFVSEEEAEKTTAYLRSLGESEYINLNI